MGGKRTLIVASVVALALALAGGAGAASFGGSDRALLDEMNRARAARGLAPLRLDMRLQGAANAHSRDMIRRDYFSHGNFSARMARFRAHGPRLAENIAWGTGTRFPARSIVRMWLRSPGHRANLLRPGFRRVGVAARSGRFTGWSATVATATFAGV